MSEGLSSHAYPLQTVGCGCGNEASAPDLNRKRLGPPALLFCLCCRVEVLQPPTLHSVQKNNICEVDHKTRSGLRLAVIISGRKKQLSGLGQPAFSSHGHHPGGSLPHGSPTSFEDDRQLPQDLVVSPGVTTLG